MNRKSHTQASTHHLFRHSLHFKSLQFAGFFFNVCMRFPCARSIVIGIFILLTCCRDSFVLRLSVSLDRPMMMMLMMVLAMYVPPTLTNHHYILIANGL